MKFGTLQVYPRQGLLVEHGLDLPSALIGRGEGSNIHIDDFSISRRHARLTVDSGRLLVEDLGSVGGTFVDGERLEPGVRHLVEDSAVLRFGEIEARYLPPETVDATLVALDANTEVVSAGGLSIALVSPETPVEAGRTATATLVVTNRGRIVDNVRVEVPDLPADWYSVDTPAFPILPGGRADVKVSIHPPRRHDSLAGGYTFTVAVRSQEYDEHPETQGNFHVLPFESATISLEAIRSKRDFRLLAENRGNDVARYELFGSDDEQAFQYGFESPAIELQPGEKRIINLSVRRPRQLFGAAQQPPFTIVGKSSSGAEISANGQLAVRPPLQKFRMPVLFSLAALVLAVTAMAVLIVTDGDGTNTANAEDPYAGVHLCTDDKAKDDQAKKNAAAANDKPLTGATVVGPYDGGRPVFGEVDKNGAPFFAQSDARWATQEYARSTELPNGKDWCGTTIEQCGCAMTSVSVMLALYDILQMPGGEPLSPKALNDWFNGAARQTDRGWVSRGYIYGDVIWSAANELSAEIARVKPGSRTVRFVRTGSGSEDDIRAELNAGRPVILEVPGHWIAAVGLDNDGAILINDPFYRDRKTLDVYKGKVRSSVHYEPSSDLSSVVITAPADVKFKITDKQGRVVNTGTGTLDAPAESLNQIPGASVAARHAWRDPTCIESAPPTDAGTNQVVLPGSRDDYTIEIISAGDQGGALAIHTYGRDGASSIATIEGGEGTKAEIAFDPNADKPVINVSTNGTPQATSTPQPGDGGAGGDTETPTPRPAPSASPAPTSTPFVEQRTAMTLSAEPGQTRVEVATNSGFELGDPIRFAPGLPNEEDNIIVGFGSFILATPLKFAHGPGEPIARLQRPPGQGPGLPPGITPPPSTGPLEPPKEVTMACSTLYQPSPKQATLICDLTVNGTFTTTRWTLNGKVVSEFSGSPSLIMTFPGDTPASVSATVCNVTLCRSTSRNEQVLFPATGTGGSGTDGTGTGGTGTPVVPTPPAGTVTVTCGTAFDQAKTPAVANITCQANFSGEFTSISWSAPGGKPANASGAKKTFETQLVNDLGAPTTVKITATVCNFGTCRTSQPLTVGIGQTKTIIDTDPQGGVPLKHGVTLLAVVTGLSGIVPQGGNVQFVVVSGGSEFPISPSAALFTVGSLSVAQVAVQTGAVSGLDTVGPVQLKAVYSGGINAFGSESLVADFNILEPIKDGCDSVDEDPGTVEVDDTCDFSTPKNLGGGTVLNSLSIAGGTLDGALNAVVVHPGQSVTVSGTVGRTEYCPGCLRQLYLGIAGYDPQPSSLSPRPAERIGPACVYSGGLPLTPAGQNYGATFNAPMTPGVYYLRAGTTLDYFCVGPPMAPPDKSVGRIVVTADVTAAVEVHRKDGDTNPWNDALDNTTTMGTTSAGDQVTLLARVPAGATGRVRFHWGNTTVLAPVCPPSAKVPEGTDRGFDCTPGQARALSPIVDETALQVAVSGRYVDPAPTRLIDPQNGASKAYPLYEAPCQPTSDPCSNTVSLKVLLTPSVTLTASPGLPGNPARMGESFTLTATVAPAKPPTSGTASALGGSVQFWAGSNKVGDPVPVGLVGATEQASITWTPRDCDNRAGSTDLCPSVGASPNEGFPFDAQDRVGVGDSYQDVHAEYITGGNADLKPGTSANVDIDIDPAETSTTIAISIPSPSPIGTSFTITATVDAPLNPFPSSPVEIPPKVEYYAGATLIQSVIVSAAMCPAEGSAWRCAATTTTINTGDLSDAIDSAGTYSITAKFTGTSQLAPSTSTPPQPLGFTKELPTMTVQMPSSPGVGQSAVIRAELTGTRVSALDNNGARIFFKHNGAALVGGLQDVVSLPGGQVGAQFNVQNLNAGTYNITVEYEGNSFYEPVTCTPSGTEATAPNCPRTLTLVIDKFTPTVTLDAITAVQVGSNLTISGNVSGSGLRSPAGGSVSFFLGGTSGTLLGTDDTIAADGDVSVPVATGLGTNFPDAYNGAIQISYSNVVARFNGNATNGNLGPAESTGEDAKLDKRASSASHPNVSFTLGSPEGYDLEATIPAAPPPTTSVSVDCNSCLHFETTSGTSWTSPAVSVVGGKAPMNIPVGTAPFTSNQTYNLRAVYSGNNNYLAANSSSFTLTLGPPPPTVSLADATMPLNGSTTLTATVTPPSGRVPTCSNCLQFKEGATLATATTFATVSVTETSSGSGVYHAQTTVSGGSTAFPTISGSPYSVWAVYAPSGGTGNPGQSSDDVGGPAASPSATVSVTARVTSVQITAGNTTGSIGGEESFTVTVTPSGATGTVKLFADDGNGGGPVEVDSDTLTSGSASLQFTAANADTYTLTATYTSNDTANYASDGTSNTHTITINPLAVTVTVAANDSAGPITVTAGASVTLKATLNYTSTITGTVQFKVNGADFGSPVSLTGGVATIPWPAGATSGSPYGITATFTSTHSNYASANTSNSVTVNTQAPP